MTWEHNPREILSTETRGRTGRLAMSAVTGCVWLALLACSWPVSSDAQELRAGRSFRDGDCYATLEGNQFTVGNAHTRRQWTVEGGQMFATSLLDLDHKVEWISTPSRLPSPSPPEVPGRGTAEMWGAGGTFGPTEAESLRVELRTGTQTAGVNYRFQVFPNAGGIRQSIERHGAAGATATPEDPHPELDTIEHLQTDRQHLRFTEVTLRDRTDQRDELVFEDEWLLQSNESGLTLQGNIFILEDTLTGNGLVFLKEAPQPEMRPIPSPFDATVAASDTLEKNSKIRHTSYNITFYGNGFQGSGQGYASALIPYGGGRAGRIAALQFYQRQIRQYRPGRDGQLLSNTWGDRSGGSKLNDAFVRSEIDAAKQLGVDIVQVDDGWEQGKTMNQPGGTVWEGFREHQPDFWKASVTRFPGGFAPLAEYAKARGMRLGKWFAPESANDFRDWKLDADQLLEWNAKEKIAGFKLDSVKIRSKIGESNYHALTDRVLRQSGGSILLDLDVTAESRQGYFGDIAAGPLFVENRYTDTHRYWPHQTLRNFWKLAQYVDPVRLRMEFLNSERNVTSYPDDPLAPANYQASTLFATVMFASPLGWFEASSLSPHYLANASPLIAAWKKERDAIYEGVTLPIGEAPDGIVWTGFQSADQGGRSGYMLVFRELNRQADWMAPRGLFPAAKYRIQLLGGRGAVSQTRDGFRVSIPQELDFVWVRLQATQPALLR